MEHAQYTVPGGKYFRPTQALPHKSMSLKLIDVTRKSLFASYMENKDFPVLWFMMIIEFCCTIFLPIHTKSVENLTTFG